MSSKLSARIDVHNATKQPRIIWVEPLGQDFTLLPSESMEITAEGGQNFFAVIEHDDSTEVYLEGPNSTVFQVTQKGLQLKCGHNREAACNAGMRHYFEVPTSQAPAPNSPENQSGPHPDP